MSSLDYRTLRSGARLAWLTLRASDGTARLGVDDVDQLETLFDAVDASDAMGLVLAGEPSEAAFLRGIDVGTLASFSDRRELQAFASRTARMLQRLHDGRRPVVAAVRGECLDFGLELAMAAHAIVAADGADVRFGLPQIELGLPPVGDALLRLPAKIGVEAALDLLIWGRRLRGPAACKLGLVQQLVRDEAVDAAAVAQVVRLAEAMRGGESRASWRGLLRGQTPLGGMRRKRALTRWQQALPAGGPALDAARLSVLDVLARCSGGPDDLRRVTTAFSETAVSDTAAAKLQTWQRARALEAWTPPAGVKAVSVRRLGIVGGGAVGADLAVEAALRGVSVRIREKAPASLGRSLTRVDRRFAAHADGPSQTRARARLSGGLELDGFATMDLILEAVPEEVSVKRRVFAELEDCIREDAIVATHPRATPVAEIGARMRFPARLVGLRFFRPLARRPLCEIVRTPATSARALATAIDFARRVNKTPVVVRDGPGFFTTRVLAAYLSHAGELVAAGYSIADIDRGARQAGWPIGPLQLLDHVGLPTAVRVGHVLTTALGPRFSVPAAVETMAAAGRRFYAAGRSPGAPRQPDARVHDLLDARAPKVGDPDELGDRLTLVAALEAVRCLQDGVLAQPSDGDVAAVLGLGYPAQRGGPFRHLQARGLPAARSRLAALEDRFGGRYAAPSLLLELAQRGADFSSMETHPAIPPAIHPATEGPTKG